MRIVKDEKIPCDISHEWEEEQERWFYVYDINEATQKMKKICRILFSGKHIKKGKEVKNKIWESTSGTFLSLIA